MPIPIFDFDEFDAIPRRAVPVRYACLVTNWTPGFLAERVLAVGELEHSCRYLPVHEFDPADGVVYEVRLSDYEKYEELLKLRTEPASPDELEQLPANHFVWADDLEEVYEKAVSATFDDLEYAPVIRWRVTPGDCKAVVAECPDLSSLAEIGSTDHQLHDKTLAEFPGTSEPSNDAASAPCFRRSGEGWALTFEGKTTYVTNIVGVRYIAILVAHPGRPFPIADLFREVNPPAPDALDATLDDLSLEETEGLELSETGLADAGDVFDDKALKQYKARLETLEELIKDASDRGNHEKQYALEEERDEIARFLCANLDQEGRPRRLDSDHEALRKRIGIAISRAVATIGKHHAELGRHLDNAIDKGGYCVYNPPTTTPSHT